MNVEENLILAWSSLDDALTFGSLCKRCSASFEPYRLPVFFARAGRALSGGASNISLDDLQEICQNLFLAIERVGLSIEAITGDLRPRYGVDFFFDSPQPHTAASAHPSSALSFFLNSWDWGRELQTNLVPKSASSRFVHVEELSSTQMSFNTVSLFCGIANPQTLESSDEVAIPPKEDISLVLCSDSILLGSGTSLCEFHGKAILALKDGRFALVYTTKVWESTPTQEPEARFKLSVVFHYSLDGLLLKYLWLPRLAPKESEEVQRISHSAALLHIVGARQAFVADCMGCWASLLDDSGFLLYRVQGQLGFELFVHRVEARFLAFLSAEQMLLHFIELRSGKASLEQAAMQLLDATSLNNAVTMRVDDVDVAVVIEPSSTNAIETRQEDGSIERMLGVQCFEDAGEPLNQESVFLLKLNRRSKKLALALALFLIGCIQELEASGHPWKLFEGAFIFVHPHQYRAVMRALVSHQLYADHIIVCEGLDYLVQKALAATGKCGGWVKDRRGLQIDDDSGYATDGSSPPEIGLIVCERRTFLTVVQAPMAASEVQSTTQACDRKGLNPRRLLFGGILDDV